MGPKVTRLLAVATILSLAASACDSLPTTPTVQPSSSAATPPPAPPTSSLTFVWTMAVDEYGLCIVGATVQVMRGQGLGQNVTQRTPCGAWDYDGGVVFRDLSPGVEMTLRASASGYVAQEKIVVPSLGPQQVVLIWLSRPQ